LKIDFDRHEVWVDGKLIMKDGDLLDKPRNKRNVAGRKKGQ
jgi:hypothetical protein